MLVAHKLFPGNITLVVVLDRYFPLFLRASVATGLPGTAFDDGSACVLSAPYEGTGIRGILEDAEDARVGRLDPDDLAVAGLT